MAYTNTWTNLTPLGTQAANEIEKYFQQLRLDVAERMDTITITGGKWSTDDPIAIDPASIGLIGDYIPEEAYIYDVGATAGSRVDETPPVAIARIVHIDIIGTIVTSPASVYGETFIDPTEFDVPLVYDQIHAINASCMYSASIPIIFLGWVIDTGRIRLLWARSDGAIINAGYTNMRVNVTIVFRVPA